MTESDQTNIGKNETRLSNSRLLMRLTDLNGDCLEEIFTYLSMKQLFAVAISDMDLVNACRRVFVRRFKCKEVNISIHHSDYKDFPQVLSLFGDIISYLRVTYDQFDVDGVSNEMIHNSIAKYCNKSLIELTFNNIQSTMQISTVFHNVEKLSFNHGCINQLQLATWFPKLQCLQFFFNKTTNTKCIEEMFPLLDELTVAHHIFTVENLKMFLDLNSQLKRFIVYNYDRKVISDLEEYTKIKCQSLHTKFEVYPCYFSFSQ